MKLACKRNTGIRDVDGHLYTNLDDLELINKLAGDVSPEQYLFLATSEHASDIYSFLEKEAAVPREVSQAVDEGKSFSGEYLKDMDYNVPEGYEVKGDLCCPVEKTAADAPNTAPQLKPTTQAGPAVNPTQAQPNAAPNQTSATPAVQPRPSVNPPTNGYINNPPPHNVPLDQTSATPAEHIGRWYNKIPGGLQTATTQAQQAMKQNTQSGTINRTTFPEWNTANLNHPFPIEHTHLEAGTGGEYSPYNANIKLNIGNPIKQQAIKEHELSHGMFMKGDEWEGRPDEDVFRRNDVVDSTDPESGGSVQLNEHYNLGLLDNNPNRYQKYVLTPPESDVRLAEIKRRYAHDTGKLVTTPEEARDAFEHFGKHYTYDEGQDNSVTRGYSDPSPEHALEKNIKGFGPLSPEALKDVPTLTPSTFKYYNELPEEMKQQLFRRMPELVQNQQKNNAQKTAEEKKRVFYHGSPTSGIKELETRLDPRLGIKGLFVGENPYAPEIFSLMPERHQAFVNLNTDKNNFIDGEITVPSENWLNSEGSIYELHPDEKDIFERAPGKFMLTANIKPTREYKVTRDDVLKRGWKIKLKEEQQKTAAADPSQTILITGHSGAGKSTLGKLLAEKLNLPLQRIDSDPEFKEYSTKDHKHWEKSLTPGTKEYDFYTNIVNNANKHTIDNSPAAAIIEGSQLGHMSPSELAKYKAHILVGGDLEQSIAQRIDRSAKKKGVTYSPEEIANKQNKARAVARYWQPGIDKFNKLPGVIKYNHTEHQLEPLVAKLKELMSKKAENILDMMQDKIYKEIADAKK